MILLICYIVTFWITSDAQFSNKQCYSEAGLDCEVNYTTTTAGCSNLSAHFPDLYHREDGLYPDRPSVFNLTPIEDAWNGRYVYPGVNITLLVPPNASFKTVKGFELIRRPDTLTEESACFVFAYDGSKLNTTTKNGKILFKIWPINVNAPTTFEFELFSLPKPPAHEQDGMAIKRFVQINPHYDLLAKPSADWITTIGYYSSSTEKYIYIEFAKPPDVYKFKAFLVRLVQLDDNDIDKTTVRNVTIENYQYWFGHVQPGRYKVTVEPQSSYQDCYCKNSFNVCVSCIRTVTKTIVISNVTSVLTTGSPKPLAQQDTTQKVIAAVLGSLIGVLLLVLLGYFLYNNRRKQQNSQTFTPDTEIDEAVRNPYVIPDNGANDSHDYMKIPIVYIINAEDHLHHKKAAEAFARFLDHHCQCHVIYAPWCLHEVLDDKFRWVINTIEKADYVIIINSELSYHQFKSWKKKENHEWKSREPSQTFDLYLSSINQITKHIINVNNHFKCIIVYFDYTSSKLSLDELCAGAEYLIPEHVHELMCQIHQIDNRRIGYDNDGFYADLVSSTEDGIYLTNCITRAANFEKQNPDWFSDYYGEKFDSGISSPTTSLGTEANSQELQNSTPVNLATHNDFDLFLHQNTQNVGTARQTSNEDNVAIARQSEHHQSTHQPLRYSDPSSQYSNDFNPPDYFEEPSVMSDDDILSQQLRQEIYELNNRMLSSQHEEIIKVNDTDYEIQSLGGHSV